MKPLAAICLAVVLLAAIAEGDSAGTFAPLPPCIPGRVHHAKFLDMPPDWRQRNYGPSCAWATTISMLRAQGLDSAADKLRKHYRGPAGPSDIHPALDRLGIRYAYTIDGDERLLDYALRSNRGAGVHWYRGHATMLVGKRDGKAVILDNNFPHGYTLRPWAQFIREWKANGGWAWVIVDRRGQPLPEYPNPVRPTP